MKNILKKLENDKESNFFVMRSKITTKFDSGEEREEFFLYYTKKKTPPSFFSGYKNLVERKMTKEEIRHFKSNISKYVKDLQTEDGIVFNLKENMFNKSDCVSQLQYLIDFTNI